ncbi:MAG: CD225/dispanin family protein [Chloroflexi bacterium]|nr:CD225/dispanin family protein [Chloroflexota bacterium]
MSGSNHTLNLILAIVVTVLCCLPLGIVAIVFAAIGMSRQGSGDYAGAESAARTARICIWISFGLGLAILAIYVLFFLLLGIGTAILGF